MDMKVDAKRIRTERATRAWSQQHLADVTDLGLRTIQRIEATGLASYESAQAIAAAFGLLVADLLGGRPAPVPVIASKLPGIGTLSRTARRELPGLVLAIGMLGAAAVTVWSSDRLWWLGPLLLASSIVVARVVANAIAARGRAGIGHATLFAFACLFASALVAFADPDKAASNIAMMIPVLGGLSVVILPKSLNCIRRCGDEPSLGT